MNLNVGVSCLHSIFISPILGVFLSSFLVMWALKQPSLFGALHLLFSSPINMYPFFPWGEHELNLIILFLFFSLSDLVSSLKHFFC